MVVPAISLLPRQTSSQQLGKYQLVTTLGQGGMGTVYLALASGFGEFRKLFVVKELRQDLTRQAGFVGMFMDEAKLAARLDHPNVVQTFEASEDNDRYFLAMEYLDGQSLSALLERAVKLAGSKLSLWMHIQILCEALAGLHYAHELRDYDGSSLRVVHRDVSPQNVFVTYHGQVKVVDFGVAKAANAGVKMAPGVFVGKFSYAAPEQILGKQVDARTDVFAVGVMLWQAISKRPFSEHAPTIAACRARTQGLEPRIAEIVPTVDPVLARICDRALALDPDVRFTSALQFRAELQDYMQKCGVRVDASEIAQLMHVIFDGERRALHGRIERAMRHTGVGPLIAEELSMPHPEKVPTAVADLSSLIEVSLERDDQKILEGYAQSKVTLVRPPSEQKRGFRMTTFMQTPRGRWIGAAALGALVVGIAFWVFSPDRVPERIVAHPLVPVVIDSPVKQSPPPPAAKPIDQLADAPEAEPELEQLVFEPEPVAPPRAKTRTTSASAAASSSRNRGREVSARQIAAPEGPPPVPVLVATPEPVASQRSVEAGTDLSFVRRSNGIAIDRENPYR